MPGKEFPSRALWICQLFRKSQEMVRFKPKLCQQENSTLVRMENGADSQDTLRRRSLAKLIGWRKAVAYGCLCAIFALVCNLSLLIWASTKSKSTSDTFVLYDGNFATLVLAGSNYAMQILIAPTREDADAAHMNGRSVDIGVFSFANWKYMTRSKKILYLSLLLTSVPFHVIFNSAIFGTVSAVDFGMYLVADDFFDIEPSIPYSGNSAGFFVYSMWKDASPQWTNLTMEDCYSMFSASYVHNFRNVVFVTNTSSDLWGYNCFGNESYHNHRPEWFCEPKDYEDSCQPDPATAQNWAVQGIAPETVFVQYCVAQPAQQSCTIQLSPQLLGVIIACNAIKVYALVRLLYSTFTPLVTIGDAMASYLDEPDPSMKGWGTISAVQLRKKRLNNLASRELCTLPYNSAQEVRRALNKRIWRNKRLRYFSAVGSSRWMWTFLFCFISLILEAMATCLLYSNTGSLRNEWKDGLGSIAPSRLLGSHGSPLNIAILTNIPQLLLSLGYLFCNSVLTRILLSREWTNYAHQRRSLRVTDPKGEQRSTYFLSIPYRFSIPVLVVSAFLHWSLSQSIFFAQVDFTSSDGSPDPNDSVLTTGFSIIGFMILLSTGAVITATLFLFGFWHFKSGIPMVLSDSRAISAACHPISCVGKAEGQRLSLKKLQYGAIAKEDGESYVGFSDGPVEPLVDGRVYRS